MIGINKLKEVAMDREIVVAPQLLHHPIDVHCRYSKAITYLHLRNWEREPSFKGQAY
jgi:hypothetical protein